MERLEIVEAFTRGGEHDRAASDGGNRKRCTTASIAIKFRQHNTREVDTLLESTSGRHGVLTDHGVNNEEHFVGVDSLTDVCCLLHQLGIHTQTTSGVNDDNIMLLVFSKLHGLL